MDISKRFVSGLFTLCSLLASSIPAHADGQASAPQVGVYRAQVTVNSATAGCDDQAGDVVEYSYVYPGPGKSTASFYTFDATLGVYTEQGYETAAANGDTVSGTATHPILPGDGDGAPITYTATWTYLDRNSFMTVGQYSIPSGCVRGETILYIRSGD